MAGVVAVLDGARGPGPGVEEAGPDLVRWSLPGCYGLLVGPWEVRRVGEPGTAPSPAPSPAPDPAAPPSFSPPSPVMLLFDTGDDWGRPASSHRAVPLAGQGDGAEASFLRWLVRADTLWLVWSREGVRAGAALFAEGDSLTGVARATTDSLDGRAPARAWRISCATLERVEGRRAPRP